LSGGAPKRSETDKLKGIRQAVRAAEGKGLPVTTVANRYDSGAYRQTGGRSSTRGPLVDRFSRQGGADDVIAVLLLQSAVREDPGDDVGLPAHQAEHVQVAGEEHVLERYAEPRRQRP
jgi:hypothetical protein